MTATTSKRQRSALARARERRAWELYTEHAFTQQRIATELHVSQRAVSKMIQRAEAAVASDLRGRVERERNRQHVRLDALYRQAVSAWHASIGDSNVRTSTRREVNGAIETTTKVQVVRKSGDHGHMANALQALADLRKLHGLDAPVKSASVNLNLNTNPNVVELPPEDYGEHLRALGVTEQTIKAVLARQAALPATANP